MDFKILFKEINEVLHEYGITKGIGFVPDDLEIHLSRKNKVYQLRYIERFTYLPDEIRTAAIDNAVHLLRNMGVQEQGIETLENGVKVTITGDHRVLQFPILELLIQNPNIEETLPRQLEEINNRIESLTKSLAFHWAINEKTHTEIQNSITDIAEILKENPDIQRKVEEIMKKHTNQEN
ncbi:hypothetical protein GF326_12935 [Candidatus Bathyarchaeota archaeon]|nr:hypothetical protein [Candidatus Bathyarchaeota archaeon]